MKTGRTDLTVRLYPAQQSLLRAKKPGLGPGGSVLRLAITLFLCTERLQTLMILRLQSTKCMYRWPGLAAQLTVRPCTACPAAKDGHPQDRSPR